MAEKEFKQWVRGLKPGTTYQLQSRVVPEGGPRGTWSNVVEFTTDVDTTKPNKPTGLTEHARPLNAVMSWDKSTEISVVGYNVYRSTTPDMAVTVRISSCQRSTWFVEPRDNEDDRYYRVTSVTAQWLLTEQAANESAPSDQIKITPAQLGQSRIVTLVTDLAARFKKNVDTLWDIKENSNRRVVWYDGDAALGQRLKWKKDDATSADLDDVQDGSAYVRVDPNQRDGGGRGYTWLNDNSGINDNARLGFGDRTILVEHIRNTLWDNNTLRDDTKIGYNARQILRLKDNKIHIEADSLLGQTKKLGVGGDPSESMTMPAPFSWLVIAATAYFELSAGHLASGPNTLYIWSVGSGKTCIMGGFETIKIGSVATTDMQIYFPGVGYKSLSIGVGDFVKAT